MGIAADSRIRGDMKFIKQQIATYIPSKPKLPELPKSAHSKGELPDMVQNINSKGKQMTKERDLKQQTNPNGKKSCDGASFAKRVRTEVRMEKEEVRDKSDDGYEPSRRRGSAEVEEWKSSK